MSFPSWATMEDFTRIVPKIRAMRDALNDLLALAEEHGLDGKIWDDANRALVEYDRAVREAADGV
jgi:hypothetical protein